MNAQPMFRLAAAVSVAGIMGWTMSLSAKTYDPSWMDEYKNWQTLADQTVTDRPSKPTIYTGNTSYNTTVGTQPLVFSGGTATFPTGRTFNNKLTETARVAFTDGVAVDFSAGWQTCTGDGMVIDFANGTTVGTKGFRLGSGKKATDYTQDLNIYGGEWTAGVMAYNSATCEIDMTGPKVNVYGGTFAPCSLGPMNGGTMTRHITVHMAGGTFVVPKMTTSSTASTLNTTVWFTGDAGTESVMRLGVDTVDFKGVTTLESGSVVRLQADAAAEARRTFNVCSNLVGSGEWRIEGDKVNLSQANCSQFSGVLTCKGGLLELGASQAFGNGAVIRIDNSEGENVAKPVTWPADAAPTAVTFELDETSVARGCKIEQLADGIALRYEITTSRELDADLDLRAYGEVVLSDGVTVDLKGHDFKISGCSCPVAGGATITDTSASGGTLHFDVASGEVSNSSVKFTGSLVLAKDGEGTFAPTLTGQDYAGGTVVNAGTMRANSRYYATGTGRTVTIREGGTLNINGKASTDSAYVLDGGTLENSGYGNSISTNSAILTTVTLDADSSVVCKANFGFIGASYGPTSLDLGGRRLSMEIASGAIFYLCRTAVTNGTLEVTKGGYLKIDDRKSAVRPLPCRTADFVLNCALDMYVDAEVHDYVNNYAGNYGSGTGRFKVFGTFRPNKDYFAACELQDGATLDLTGKTGAWSTKSKVTQNGIARYVTFAEGAHVTVNLAGRADMKRGAGVKVLSWDAAPKGVELVPDAETAARGYRLSIREDGAYVSSGLQMIVR